MQKLKTIGPAIRAIDTRTVKVAPKTADRFYLSPEHKAWAKGVKQRAGWRCEAVENGRRCEVKYPARLFADHIHERRDGGDPLDPNNGQCLCGSHHTTKTLAARAARLARPSTR